MKKIILSTFITAFIFSLFLTSSLAQKTSATTTAKQTVSTKSLLLATVNIYNATNTKVDNNTYQISFQLNNRVGTQSDIRYGVQLVDQDSNQIVDMYLVNQSLTLTEGEAKDLTLTYTIPDYIPNGNYKIQIVAKNSIGLPLAISPINFPEQIIAINNGSNTLSLNNCSLDANTTNQNNLSANLDPNSQSKVTCKIDNFNNLPNKFNIQLITHKNDQFGDILLNKIIDKDSFSLDKDNKTITFDLSTASLSGNYEVDIFLINSSQAKISTSAYLKYNIKGNMATIQNTILDKTSYKKGDIAKLQVFSSITSSNPKDTLSIDAKIFDNQNNLCGEISKKISSRITLTETDLDISIAKDCSSVNAKISILNGDEILANSEISSNNKTININPNIKNATKQNLNNIYIIIFILILVLIGYGIIVFKKGNNK